MSPRLNYIGAHFSEIFSAELNFELKTYARGGMSNGGIALQLLEAIKQKPDLIIFNLTFSDRMEFPWGLPPYEKVSVSNINYKYKSDELTVVQGKKGNFVSDSISALLTPVQEFQVPNYPEEKYEAVKLFFKELYSEDWKYQVDCMMMYSVIHSLYTSNIDFILFWDGLRIDGSPVPFTWLDSKNNISKHIDYYLKNRMDPKITDPGFHTTVEDQKEIAKFVINHYKKYF